MSGAFLRERAASQGRLRACDKCRGRGGWLGLRVGGERVFTFRLAGWEGRDRGEPRRTLLIELAWSCLAVRAAEG